MKEYKVFIWVGVFMILVTGGLIWLAGQSEDISVSESKELSREGITLFYGDGCPHCEDVEKYIEENNITNKVEFVSLEIWENKSNAKIMEEAAIICELDLEKIGVPFLFDGSVCYVGGPDVQDFFKDKAEL